MATSRLIRTVRNLCTTIVLPLWVSLGSTSHLAAQEPTQATSPNYVCKDRPKDIAAPPDRAPAPVKDRRGKEASAGSGGEIAAKPPCPEGQVPYPIERYAPKGNPFFSGTAVDVPYNYADSWASAGGSIPLFDGSGVVTNVDNPAVSSLSGTHSLFETSVQGGEGNGNIVEIGWIVNAGDSGPHLFVFHWLGWSPTCYNGCGWVQSSATLYPGMPLSPGSQTYMGYVFHQGNWWAWYADQWVGYFPGSIWSNGFSKASLTQWFGEVYENDPTPATDMGDGYRANVDSAARFWYPCDVNAAEWVCWINPTPSTQQPEAPWYTILNVGGSALRFGGPGGSSGVGVNP